MSIYREQNLLETSANLEQRRLFEITGLWEQYYATLKQLPERLKQLVPFVVEALPTFKRYKIKHLLDLGCGAGRHCIYLSKSGFNVVGVEVSKSALELAKKWAREENVKNTTFLKATMTNIPFNDCSFDAVISISVIHHAVKSDIVKTVGEIHRVLKRNGVFLANLTSAKDPRYGIGEKVETDTFRTLEGYEEKRFEELHHYFTEKEVSKLFASFSSANIELLSEKPHYWKITAVK